MDDETRSYHDPLGNRIRALSDEHERYLARFPEVASLYDGFYASFKPLGKEGVTYLAGAESIIGSAIRLAEIHTPIGAVGVHAPAESPVGTQAPAESPVGARCHAPAEAEDAPLSLLNLEGSVIAQLDEELSQRIGAFLAAGWEVRCVLSLVYYNNEIRGFTGEFACLCYNPEAEPEHREALRTFIDNIVMRITSGEHPGLRLTQQQLVRVLESKGTWYLTKAQPPQEQARGWAVYKRRKSATEYLIAAGLRQNPGCLVASWVGAAVLVALLAWLLWRLIQWLIV